MTQNVVRDCFREPVVSDVIIVDNGADYKAVASERILRPTNNLGWLAGTNYGVSDALKRLSDTDIIVALNNDTRLSHHFFQGITEAVAQNPNCVVVPCYDDHVVSQNSFYQGPLEQFNGEPVEVAADIIDGTCYALSVGLHRRLGPLDSRFGRWGWGGIDDFAIRVRAQGGLCLVTRRSYLQHARGTTAHSIAPFYERYATAEMRIGMTRKYGTRWRMLLGDPTPPDPLRTRASDVAWVARERMWRRRRTP